MLECKHVWVEEYYGYLCTACGLFYPYGCAPWEDFEDYESGYDWDGYDWDGYDWDGYDYEDD